jgi:hypothetical protein
MEVNEVLRNVGNPTTSLHGVTIQKTETRIFIAVKKSQEARGHGLMKSGME